MPVYNPNEVVHGRDCDNRHKEMNKKIDKLSEAIQSIKVSLAKLPEEIIEKSEGRFASKLTERIVYGLVGLIILTFVGNLLYIANRNNEEATDARLQAIERIINDNLEIID